MTDYSFWENKNSYGCYLCPVVGSARASETGAIACKHAQAKEHDLDVSSFDDHDGACDDITATSSTRRENFMDCSAHMYGNGFGTSNIEGKSYKGPIVREPAWPGGLEMCQLYTNCSSHSREKCADHGERFYSLVITGTGGGETKDCTGRKAEASWETCTACSRQVCTRSNCQETCDEEEQTETKITFSVEVTEDADDIATSYTVVVGATVAGSVDSSKGGPWLKEAIQLDAESLFQHPAVGGCSTCLAEALLLQWTAQESDPQELEVGSTHSIIVNKFDAAIAYYLNPSAIVPSKGMQPKTARQWADTAAADIEGGAYVNRLVWIFGLLATLSLPLHGIVSYAVHVLPRPKSFSPRKVPPPPSDTSPAETLAGSITEI